jgi:hypothetical protein
VEERKRWVAEIIIAIAAAAPAAAAAINRSLLKQTFAMDALNTGSKVRLRALFNDLADHSKS